MQISDAPKWSKMTPKWPIFVQYFINQWRIFGGATWALAPPLQKKKKRKRRENERKGRKKGKQDRTFGGSGRAQGESRGGGFDLWGSFHVKCGILVSPIDFTCNALCQVITKGMSQN